LHFTGDEAIELTLDVMRNAANKIAAALGADAPRVEVGIERYPLDVGGEVRDGQPPIGLAYAAFSMGQSTADSSVGTKRRAGRLTAADDRDRTRRSGCGRANRVRPDAGSASAALAWR
jgi:hypothetical protein